MILEVDFGVWFSSSVVGSDLVIGSVYQKESKMKENKKIAIIENKQRWSQFEVLFNKMWKLDSGTFQLNVLKQKGDILRLSINNNWHDWYPTTAFGNFR